MSFKFTLQCAINLHKETHGETITKTYVAAMLFPNRKSPKAQRMGIEDLKTKHISVEQLGILLSIFTDTYSMAWISDNLARKYVVKFADDYTQEDLSNNTDLSLFWEQLNKGQLNENFIKKYL